MPDAEDAALLHVLRKGPRTRGEVAATSGLSRNTVAARLTRLVENGWLVAGDGADPARGRPSQRYAINPRAALVLVARFDQSRIHAALASLSGQVLASAEADIAEGDSDCAVGQLATLIARLKADTPPDQQMLAVIGVPGPVSDLSRTIAWSRVGELPGDLGHRLGLPVLVENDANLMALGTARDAPGQDLLFVLVQTGIGAGLMLNGRLHRGAAGWAGEVGHIPVSGAAGRVCTCGNVGCLASIADTPAMMRGLHPPASTVADLRTRLLARDIDAIVTLREAGRHLGEAIAPW